MNSKERIIRKNIIFFTKYDELGASSRVRMHQYINKYKKNFNIYVNPLLDKKYLKAKYSKNHISFLYIIKLVAKRIYHVICSSKYDIVWVEKELFPWFPRIFECYLSSINTKTVFDYDDAIHHIYDKNDNSFIKKLFGKKIKRIMKKSSVVTVGNEYLNRYAKKSGARKVIYLPTCVNTNILVNKDNTQNKKIIIGWIGTPYTFKYVIKYLPNFKKISYDKNVEFHFCGAGSSLLDNQTFVNVNWGVELEKSFLTKIDIGIMPLFDDFFEKGKCGYKLLQYMSYSKPVVASPVGANKKIVEHGYNGFLCNTIVEWENALLKLISDKNMRINMGKNGRKKVIGDYSTNIYLNTVNKLLKDL